MSRPCSLKRRLFCTCKISRDGVSPSLVATSTELIRRCYAVVRTKMNTKENRSTRTEMNTVISDQTRHNRGNEIYLRPEGCHLSRSNCLTGVSSYRWLAVSSMTKGSCTGMALQSIYLGISRSEVLNRYGMGEELSLTGVCCPAQTTFL